MSANYSIQRTTNNKPHLKKIEKRNEQFINLMKNKKECYLVNSPLKNNKKDNLIFEKPINEKNLLSEYKEIRTKTILPKIKSSTAGAIPRNHRRMVKIGIDADQKNNKINNNLSKDQSESIELSLKKKNSSNFVNIGCNINRMGINYTIKEIKNKIKINENNLIDDKLLIFTEQNKEKKKQNDIVSRKNSFSKNNKLIDKLSINFNQKKKEKEPSLLNKEIKNEDINKININNNNIKKENINYKIVINGNKKEQINIINDELKLECNDKSIEKEQNISLENDKTKDKTANDNIDKSLIKFDKNASILYIYNEKNCYLQKNDENSRNVNLNNQNSNMKININDEIKYSNYDLKQVIKSSANSNKNLSEIPEQINMNLSTSKFEPIEFGSSNNKANGESSSDKNYALIQSLSNNIETDNYLHKNIICKNRNIFLGKVINENSRTIIYKGIDLNLGDIICVKRYIDKNNIEEYQNELEIYELIEENENVIKYYGSKNDEEGSFLFLEYASGDNLKKIIELCGGKLNEKIIRKYTKQILNALLYLHTNKKVAHRDIKCSNILLDKNGIIKLIDFGSAGIMNKKNKKENTNKDINNKNNEEKNDNNNNENKDPEKPFHGFKGSWPWCAPEILANKYYGTKCDIWSLGCAIIEMGGMEPWNNTLNTYYQYIQIVGNTSQIPAIPSQFSDELKDFLSKCLVKDPDQRADANKLLNHFFIAGTTLENKTVLMV